MGDARNAMADTNRSINILVGTMTGTAELVADEMTPVLRDAGFDVTVTMMDNVAPEIFAPGGVFIICSSTYGNGDVPDNAQAFYAALQQQRPDLSAVIYGVVALGDITYKATFCEGGQQFDRLLAELGARRAGAPLLHDASSGTLAEDVACEWARRWVEHDLAPTLETARA